MKEEPAPRTPAGSAQEGGRAGNTAWRFACSRTALIMPAARVHTSPLHRDTVFSQRMQNKSKKGDEV